MAAAESDGEEAEEEDLVSFGTPLKPLEEGERIKKPVLLQDQTVRDEKGRYKRFHGAFSGGFSAGYFNTVGSKEGWAPSSYISSRQKRAEKVSLNPECFMDDEDLGEHGIAPKGITVTDEYASKSQDKIQEKARHIAGISGPIPAATNVLDEFITPAKISIGVDLLRKMGWKEGQGVGPRAKRKPRKQKPEPDVKIYGCALPPGSEDSEEEDEYQPENVTFAPKDIMPVDLAPKDNVRGLGYQGLDPTQALFGVSEEHLHVFRPETSALLGDLQHSKGGKLGISGQAFGVGALEEEDDDIYATESFSRYDTVLKDEEPGDGLFGWTAPKQYKSKQGIEKELKYIGKILDGFSLASKTITPPKKIHLPPDLPRDYRPVHYFRPVVKVCSENSHLRQTLAESTGKLEREAALQSRHQKTASQRRELLGETHLKGPATSVLEFLSDKDKERIQEMKRAAKPRGGEAPVQAQERLRKRFQPPSPQSTPGRPPWQLILGAQLATTGPSDFRPFAKDPGKQKRYENYVQSLTHGKTGVLESCLDSTLTEWEQRRELEEFARAAALYKSSSSVLASRFTSAKHEDDSDTVEVARDEETAADDKATAAKMKMFGKLTRETFEWHPDKLLCKRFNVPDPYSESCIVGLPKVKRDKYSVFNFLTASEPSSATFGQITEDGAQRPERPNKPKKTSRWDMPDREKEKRESLSEFISFAQSKVDVKEQPETLREAKGRPESPTPTSSKIVSEVAGLEEEVAEESRPPMDLFKAIFASSSDEKSSEDESENEEQTAPSEAAPEHLKPPTPPSPEVQEFPLKVSEVSAAKVSVTVTSSPAKQVVDLEEFGPQLPPVLPSDILSKHEEVQLASSSEVLKKDKFKKSRERHKTKREHKSKKEKKKKHKKSKHKGKHKSKKSEKSKSSDTAESSNSNSEGENTDIPPQEFLRRLKHLPL